MRARKKKKDNLKNRVYLTGCLGLKNQIFSEETIKRLKRYRMKTIQYIIPKNGAHCDQFNRGILKPLTESRLNFHTKMIVFNKKKYPSNKSSRFNF